MDRNPNRRQKIDILKQGERIGELLGLVNVLERLAEIVAAKPKGRGGRPKKKVTEEPSEV